MKKSSIPTADLSMLKPNILSIVMDRCGKHVIADGLECPYCGALEAYKDGDRPGNVEKWAFVIRAYRVDNKSECTNCRRWF